VRPEEARLVIEDQALSGGFQLRGMVEAIEPDFAHNSQLLHLRTGKYRYVAIIRMSIPLRLGDTAEIFFPIDKFYFFDSDGGERIR
jgi:hypothetical protein